MAFYARLKGASLRDNAALLERVGIADAARRRVGTYSKGMRQRLGIAQALIGAPRLLLFDEPTSGLDPASRHDVYEMIDALRGSGATVLISTHALAEVEDRVDRAAIMHRGRLLAAGTLAELRHGVAAEARMRLKVRPCTTGQLLAALPAGARCVERSDASLDPAVAPAAKMATLRAVAAGRRHRRGRRAGRARPAGAVRPPRRRGGGACMKALGHRRARRSASACATAGCWRRPC